MPRTDTNEVYRNGVLVSSSQVTVSDAQLVIEQAPQNLIAAYTTLRAWAQDAATTSNNWATLTAAQKDTVQLTVVTRLGHLFNHLADLLIATGVTDGS